MADILNIPGIVGFPLLLMLMSVKVVRSIAFLKECQPIKTTPFLLIHNICK